MIYYLISVFVLILVIYIFWQKSIFKLPRSIIEKLIVLTVLIGVLAIFSFLFMILCSLALPLTIIAIVIFIKYYSK